MDTELMVFDWDKAAQIIKDKKAKTASAGLAGEWTWIGGYILANGEPIGASYTYLASTWAKPELSIAGEVWECYKMQSETDGWDAHTCWPESARAILKSK